jgi:UDP-N-acetylglucosamine acyltransferase
MEAAASSSSSSSVIHPTAVVHPRARIGERCEIGPYCVIGAQVTIGPRNRLHSHVVIDGETVFGSDNEIFPFASIGLQTQDLKWRGGRTRTEIGDFNTIREAVTIHSATGDGEATRIGSHNHILAYSHIAHNTVLGNHTIISSAGLAGHVIIEDRAVIGGHSLVHQFCRVGSMAIVGGCSKVVQDIPPYMLADGNPAITRTVNKVGLERNGVAEESVAALKQAFRLLFRENLSISNALARIETDLPNLVELRHLVHFIRASDRGISK